MGGRLFGEKKVLGGVTTMVLKMTVTEQDSD